MSNESLSGLDEVFSEKYYQRIHAEAQQVCNFITERLAKGAEVGPQSGVYPLIYNMAEERIKTRDTIENLVSRIEALEEK